MKKIYLDWNIINHLEENPELFEFILQYQSHFVFVYSPAHFSDLMKSYKENGSNEYFEKDLKRLENICETHLMRYFDKELCIHRCPPTEFLEKEGQDYPIFKDVFKPDFFKDSLSVDGLDLYGPFRDGLQAVSFDKTIEIPLIGCFSNGFELLNGFMAFLEKVMTDKEFVRTIRAKVVADAKDKEIARINDYDPDKVIGAINSFFARYGSDVDVVGIIKKAILENQQGDEKLLFESLYTSLDLMSFHPDKRDFMNIMTDADHAFYGGYCDVLVTDDAKMRLKAKAVYSYFGIQTKIIGKQELLQYLKDEISGEMKIEESVEEVMSNQHIPEKYNEGDVYLKWRTLDHPFFGYFDKLEYQLDLSSGQSCLAFTNQLRYTYFTETDKLFEIVKVVLHETDIIESFENEYVQKYKSNDKCATFNFCLGPTLQLFFAVEERNEFLIPILYMIPSACVNAA